MKTRASAVYLLISATLIFALYRCSAVDFGNLDPDDFTNAQGGVSCEEITFSNDVMPIFSQTFGTNRCSNGGCHGDGDANGGLNLDVDEEADGADGIYANLQSGSRVDTDSPESSLILRKPLGELNHGGSNLFGSTSNEAYQTLLCWIEAGAENN